MPHSTTRNRPRTWSMAAAAAVVVAVTAAAVVAVTPPLPTALAAAAPKVNGRLERVGPYRLLRVWGGPREMGFAHGYLIGQDFVICHEAFLRAYYGDRIDRYESSLATLNKVIRIPPDAKAEIRGIFDGLKAARGDVPELTPLHRPLSIDDLVFLNAMDTLRAFGCSGFTVWGPRAGAAGVITTRNFDYLAYSPEALARQLILVRQPNGRRRVATITWPGYIGAVTGVNDQGVAAFMHDGTGPASRRREGTHVPIALLLKDVLETAGPGDARTKTKALLTPIISPFSYMIRIVTPRTAGTTDAPVSVFHVDMDGLGENPIGSDLCVTTNHYLDAQFKPPANAGAWSRTRYATLQSSIGPVVTPASAWASLRAVALVNYSEPVAGTLHSLVLYPEQRRLDLALATWEHVFTPAPFNDPVSIPFDQLFGPGPGR